MLEHLLLAFKIKLVIRVSWGARAATDRYVISTSQAQVLKHLLLLIFFAREISNTRPVPTSLEHRLILLKAFKVKFVWWASTSSDWFENFVVEERNILLVSKLDLTPCCGERHDKIVNLVLRHTSLLINLIHELLLLSILLHEYNFFLHLCQFGLKLLNLMIFLINLPMHWTDLSFKYFILLGQKISIKHIFHLITLINYWAHLFNSFGLFLKLNLHFLHVFFKLLFLFLHLSFKRQLFIFHIHLFLSQHGA